MLQKRLEYLSIFLIENRKLLLRIEGIKGYAVKILGKRALKRCV